LRGRKILPQTSIFPLPAVVPRSLFSSPFVQARAADAGCLSLSACASLRVAFLFPDCQRDGTDAVGAARLAGPTARGFPPACCRKAPPVRWHRPGRNEYEAGDRTSGAACCVDRLAIFFLEEGHRVGFDGEYKNVLLSGRLLEHLRGVEPARGGLEALFQGRCVGLDLDHETGESW